MELGFLLFVLAVIYCALNPSHKPEKRVSDEELKSYDIYGG
jgi:hypothetical protein